MKHQSPTLNRGGGGGAPIDPLARLLTPADLAAAWQLSEQSIRRLFQDQPGVLKIGNTSPRGKRSYQTLRIPAGVVERVFTERSK